MPLQHTYLSYNQHLYSHYFLCNYLPASAGRDNLSQSLLRFKKGRQPDLDAFIDCSISLFSTAPILSGAVIVRALHHQETTASGTVSPLDLLGQQLAQQYSHHYLPGLVLKHRSNQPLKLFSKPRRDEELQGLYYLDAGFASYLPHPPVSWVIIDDVLTSGSTARAIIHAIDQVYPDSATPINLFTLAKATSTPTSLSAPLQGRHYRFEEQDPTWTMAEESLSCYTFLQLKTMILGDNF
jgi:predicted amidophosphoribosyltransferase